MDMKIDYSKKFLNPAKIELNNAGCNISFGGESIVFKGKVFSVKTDGEIESKITVEDYLFTDDRFSNQTVLNVCLNTKDKATVLEYSYFDGEWENIDEIVVNKTNLSGIGAFIRKGKVSFMLSLDFPYSKIKNEGNRVSIGCDPIDKINKDNEYIAHSLTVCATYLTGKIIDKFDRAEIECFSEYVQSRMPKNFNGNRPIYSTTCITNRMTDVRDGRVFYSMYDNPTLTLDTETLKEEVRLCAELGIEYYQLFEGYFDWEEDGSSERNLKEIVALGKSLGVRVGDYITALELNCWHYNYHDRHVKDQDLLALGQDGSRYFLCYGNDRTVEMLTQTVVESIRRNGEEMICVDGNCALPCYDVSHGHNAGSYYKHIRGMVTFFERMNQTSPYFMTWTNAGNWIEFMPKLLWYNQNVYLTDPHPRDYSSSLNNLKYYGDCRREQMVTVHNKYFVPYTAFANCEYYAFRRSRVADDEFFEYSFLQGLAVTPNICLGEMRTFFERTASKKLPEVKAFIKKWLKFIRDNIDCWKFVYQLGDSPNAGANEAYAHINGDKGFICFVNQNNYENEFTFSLDDSIGLKGESADKFILSETYPEEKYLTEQTIPCASYGDKITIKTPAFGVRIIKVERYEEDGKIRLYGVKGELKEKDGAYVADLEIECGKKVDCAVYFKDNGISDVQVKTKPNVPKYFFPSSISNLKTFKSGAYFTVNSPRDYFKREISEWCIDGSQEKYKLNLENSDFAGAYIHNFYKENQKMTLSVFTGKDENQKLSKQDNESLKTSCPTRRATVYIAKIDIPFIEVPTMSCCYGYDEILELVFVDNIAVKSLKAYIDGEMVQINEYIYPPHPKMKAFYIELVGKVKSGTCVELKLEVEWNDDCKREKVVQKQTEGAQVIQ